MKIFASCRNFLHFSVFWEYCYVEDYRGEAHYVLPVDVESLGRISVRPTSAHVCISHLLIFQAFTLIVLRTPDCHNL